jgi:hypothetical protein
LIQILCQPSSPIFLLSISTASSRKIQLVINPAKIDRSAVLSRHDLAPPRRVRVIPHILLLAGRVGHSNSRVSHSRPSGKGALCEARLGSGYTLYAFICLHDLGKSGSSSSSAVRLGRTAGKRS